MRKIPAVLFGLVLLYMLRELTSNQVGVILSALEQIR